MLRPVKDMETKVYLYCPSIEEGIETGTFDAWVSYNNTFTYSEDVEESVGTFEGEPYTHIYTFRNNTRNDFYDLNSQFFLNGVASDKTDYSFIIQMQSSTGKTYTKTIPIRVTDVARNYLVASTTSIVPNAGNQFWIDACTYIWNGSENSSAVTKNIIAVGESEKQTFQYFFSNHGEMHVEDFLDITREGNRYTFTVKSGVEFPDFLVLEANIRYDAPYVDNLTKEVALNQKILLIQKTSYNGSAYDENYEYIYPKPYSDGCIRLALKCPSWDVDSATIDFLGDVACMTTGID